MRLLLLDIETAPSTAYVWSLWKENIPLVRLQEAGYTLCWAAKWLGEDWIYFSKDALQAHRMLEEADAVVTYNGIKFDIPTLNKDFALEGLAPPAPFKNIDLYQVVRQHFRFPSNKLEYVVEAFDIGRKVKHAGFEIWEGCMRGDKASWEVMREYNENDVIIMEELYNKLLPWIKNHPNHALYTDSDRPVCPNCGGVHLHSHGLARTNVMTYRRFQCQDCGTWARGRYAVQDKEQKINIITQEK